MAAPETLGRVPAPGPLSWLFSPLFKGAEGAETTAASAAVKSRAHRALCVIFSQILLVCFIRLRLKYEKYLLYNLVYMWEIVKKRAENVPNLWWGSVGIMCKMCCILLSESCTVYVFTYVIV